MRVMEAVAKMPGARGVVKKLVHKVTTLSLFLLEYGSLFSCCALTLLGITGKLRTISAAQV